MARPWTGGGPLGPLAVYAGFAIAIFLLQGGRPALGSDHVSYIQLAESLVASCPAGDYWREGSSVRNFGVLLAYLHGITSEPVLAMKLVLAVVTVLYLLAAERLFALFTTSRWRAVLFALLSAFAVSFGIASWGLTDSTALLPRSLVAPIIVFSAWWWFRFDGSPLRYLAFAWLVLGSLLHLSAFYAIAVLAIVEVLDLLFIGRRWQLAPAFAIGLAGSMALLFALEYAGLSSKMLGVQVPEMLRQVGLPVPNLEAHIPEGCRKAPLPRKAPEAMVSAQAPAPASPAAAVATPAGPATATAPTANAGIATVGEAPQPLTAKQAWDIELKLRPWRNMPLPLVNLANALSSSALILALGAAGAFSAWRRGWTRADGLMAAFAIAVPVFALGPQTLLWLLRSRTNIFPINIEEVRALGLIVIPALYFVLRLFEHVVASGGPRMRLKAGAIVVGVLALPLVMKGLPGWVRESMLEAMTTLHIVDRADESRMSNARAALGLSAAAAPLYYSTRGVRAWLERNTPEGTRILTDRDDMILLRNRSIVGPRQVGATTYYATPQQADLYLRVSRAMSTRDPASVTQLAREYQAQYVVVPWRAAGAAFADDAFSVLAAAPQGARP